jgi:hypothetical protein
VHRTPLLRVGHFRAKLADLAVLMDEEGGEERGCDSKNAGHHDDPDSTLYGFVSGAAVSEHVAFAVKRRPVQARAGTEFAACASTMVSFFNLGPYSNVRIELTAITPTGPYRLEVDHPAKTFVEYFETPFAALVRHAEIESALSGKPSAVASIS